MKILVIGGTRFFGIHMIGELLSHGHEVTIATRGHAEDEFGDRVNRLMMDAADAGSVKAALEGTFYDVVIDKVAYSSADIRRICDVIRCRKFIHMSSTAVYDPLHMDTCETDYDPFKHELVWLERADADYDEGKRQAEAALAQQYDALNWTAVRYPFVVGTDDYTGRLKFYADHVRRKIPMHIDDIDMQMGLIRSNEAGKFMAFLAESDLQGPVNGCAAGTISVREILDYISEKTGKKPVLSEAGDEAPYNGLEEDYSINTQKAQEAGYHFSSLKDWIYELLDELIRK